MTRSRNGCFQRRPLVERFWAKVDKRGPDECWPWIGGKKKRGGHGHISLGGAAGPLVGAHRVSYELHYGPIPEGIGYHGLCVCHRCDNPPCVNPAHLFLGTHTENVRDMLAKGRHARAKLTPDLAAKIKIAPGSLREVAKHFGITHQQVSRIRHGKSWATKAEGCAP